MDQKELADKLRDLVGAPDIRLRVRDLIYDIDPPKPTLEDEFHALIEGFVHKNVQEVAMEIFHRRHGHER